MEEQPQYSEFKKNSENIQSCTMDICIFVLHKVLQ